MWQAAKSCLRAGLAGPELDTAGALAMATAQGVQPSAAATLLAAFHAGMHAGRKARKDAEETAGP